MGEKKSVYANYVLHNLVISVPGVNSFKKLLKPVGDNNVLDYLYAKGYGVIVIAYDSDKCVNQIPRCKQRGIKLATLQSSGVFDPRGIRQLAVQARPLGSLLAGIKSQQLDGLPAVVRFIEAMPGFRNLA